MFIFPHILRLLATHARQCLFTCPKWGVQKLEVARPARSRLVAVDILRADIFPVRVSKQRTKPFRRKVKSVAILSRRSPASVRQSIDLQCDSALLPFLISAFSIFIRSLSRMSSEPQSSGPRRWLASLSPSKIKVAGWFTPALATDWLAALILLIIGRHFADQAPFQQPIKPFLGDPTVSNCYCPFGPNLWLKIPLTFV